MSDRELIQSLARELAQLDDCYAFNSLSVDILLKRAYDRLTRIGDDEEPYGE